MTNINNYNLSHIKLVLSNSDYWDFFLTTDSDAGPSTACVSAFFDFNDADVFTTSGIKTIASLTTWTGATNTGYTFSTIGLTGIDNGLITFNKTSGDTSNTALLAALTGSTLIIPSGDTRFFMNRVSGTTGQFVYPLNLIADAQVGNYMSLNGGFYQGYYKIDGSTYETLPVRVNKAWVAEFWLRKEAGTTGSTLNEAFPENKGLFFYMGTRAENKFWNTFDGVDSGCTSGCTSESGCTDDLSPWCTIPKETEVSILGDYNTMIPLSPPSIEISLVTNEFLIYGRAKSGSTGCGTCGGSHDPFGKHTICSYDGKGVVVVTEATEITNRTNPFLIYGRASKNPNGACGSCGGNHDGFGTETVCSFTGFTKPMTTLDYKADVTDNALGFRIKDDGSIGYRLLKFSGACLENNYTSGYTVEESYSVSGLVSDDIWTNVVLRFVTDPLDDCQLQSAKKRQGKLMFYINGRLKHVVRDMDEFVARRLAEYKSKQVGVPFNMSLGGGSLGLLESQTFDGLDMEDRNLPIEQNFAGSFIGSISQFKFNTCDVTFPDIQNNYRVQRLRYFGSDELLMDDDGNYLVSDQNEGITWI